jgi:glycosyltransferase involved in cell wall biosynthesis
MRTAPVTPDDSVPKAPAPGVGSARGASAPEARSDRLLVVSHPAVVSVNQEVYRELSKRGWQVAIVVPSRWRHTYAAGAVRPQALAGLEGSLLPTPVALAGRPQRHFYLARCRGIARRFRPDVAFLEAEPFSLAAVQWGAALRSLRIPFGVQSYENIDRSFPRPVGWLRSRVLRDATFVAARSDTAGQLVRRWGASGEVGLAPPAVPSWERLPEAAAATTATATASGKFTIGYAGRLVPSKGLDDLLEAVRMMQAPVELLLIGDGEMRAQLEGQPIPGSRVRVIDDLTHAEMPAGYAQIDVLVLPSRTTPTWKEQFGRVIVEALWCGVPVVGSDSGEIPWLIGLTGGGVVFPEGDRAALATELARLRDQPEVRERFAAAGNAQVRRLFTVPAATDALERLLDHAVHARAGGAPPR